MCYSNNSWDHMCRLFDIETIIASSLPTEMFSVILGILSSCLFLHECVSIKLSLMSVVCSTKGVLIKPALFYIIQVVHKWTAPFFSTNTKDQLRLFKYVRCRKQSLHCIIEYRSDHMYDLFWTINTLRNCNEQQKIVSRNGAA